MGASDSRDSKVAQQLQNLPADKRAIQRVALVIQYRGTHFHGWQRQANAKRTIQAEIERVIASVLGKKSALVGAGRTDAGVHAAAQVAHFAAPVVIPAERWSIILNDRLGDDIVIRASAKVANDWHAQFSASWRRYRYTFYTSRYPNLFVQPYVWHYYRQPLNQSLMLAALQPMVGYHNLAAFHRTGSNRTHSWVELQDVQCSRSGDFVQIELQAKGFLYGMVRLIMGLITQVGEQRLSTKEFAAIWQKRRRDLVKYSAPPQGLCLLRVGYPTFPFEPKVWVDTQPQFQFLL
ncbi:tRNA pseudouridine(38-40) synthase TruA [cf. Phormidesmis sp. LEGE 11477]|uniref:tRNA pseudouridine(38-40) synthase TruA n=1 Tax=cf. Phormidesmis sp. LEGE 11477 TaxID=1828680 RepID=UPI00187E3389|nr:tRNA pseudouridine(38-40) synthase TruA [cf. Phormidesmis sp. LEGE 11477]MBE9061469.1 tRNA pseudouridine(38-40) synthase TruA [cf. Phormidesmis sp. LEGE 11477]